MRKVDKEYESLKKFIAWACNNGSRSTSARSESHPILILERAERQGIATRAQLKQGLKEAVRDTLTKFSVWSAEKVSAADAELRKIGAPTLTELQMAFSADLKQIERRGHIETEEEFYLVRNALDIPLVESNARRANKLMAMLGEFEST